ASFSGKGLRDTSRVASGDATMWSEILLENREAVGHSLEKAAGELAEIVAHLKDGDEEKLLGFLQKAKDLRDRSFP
ncbi:MAG: prephenate dehydrogenase dimerization domain-containing protein, partial [Verrucomicrobiota bacterium]